MAPKNTTPVVDTPVVDTPVVDTPVVDTPVVDTPVVDTPVAVSSKENVAIHLAALAEAVKSSDILFKSQIEQNIVAIEAFLIKQ